MWKYWKTVVVDHSSDSNVRKKEELRYYFSSTKLRNSVGEMWRKKIHTFLVEMQIGIILIEGNLAISNKITCKYTF